MSRAVRWSRPELRPALSVNCHWRSPAVRKMGARERHASASASTRVRLGHRWFDSVTLSNVLGAQVEYHHGGEGDSIEAFEAKLWN